MLGSYNVSTEDVEALVEVLISVKDRELNYMQELEILEENGFKSTLLEMFGSLDSAKTYFSSHRQNYPQMQGKISSLIDYINRLSRK